MNKPVILMGNGGHAAVITDLLLKQQRHIIGFTAPQRQENRYNIPYLGTDDMIDSYSVSDVELVLCLGSINIPFERERIFTHFKNKGYVFSSVIHPSAVISTYAVLGEGVHILANTVIESFVRIADNTIINTSSSINHDCHIGRHCHLGPGITLSGNVKVGDLVHIGPGTTIIQDIHVGSNVLIGAGSLVIRPIRDGRKAFGVPAREVEI